MSEEVETLNEEQIQNIFNNHLKNLKNYSAIINKPNESNLNKAQIYGMLGYPQQMYQHIKQLTKSEKQSEQYEKIQKTYKTLVKQQNGDFDFNSIFKQRAESFFIYNISDYISRDIEVFKHETMGTGIRATKNIKVGQIIMVEKAFLVGDYDQMFEQLTQKRKLASNSQLNDYLSLCGGDDYSHETLVKKCDTNCFDIMQQLFADNKYILNDQQTGLFLKSSLFNHSCCYNVESIFFNDIVIKVAAKSIKKGEQLFNIYAGIGLDGMQDFFNEMKETYNFRCNCDNCEHISQQIIDEFDVFYQQLEEHCETINNNPTDKPLIKISVEKSIMVMENVTRFVEQHKLSMQWFLSDNYRLLAGYCVKYSKSAQIGFRIAERILFLCLQYCGIDVEQSLKQRVVVEKTKEKNQFTSYTFTTQFIYTAFFQKYQKKSEYINTLRLAKQYHELVLGQLVSFETLYTRNLKIYKMDDDLAKL